MGSGQNAIFRPSGGYYKQLVTIQLRAADKGRCTVTGPLAYRKLYVRVPSRRGGPWGSGSHGAAHETSAASASNSRSLLAGLGSSSEHQAVTRTPHGQVAFRIDQRTLRGRSQGNARRTLRRGSPIGAFSMRARRRRRHPKGRVRAHGARDTRAPSRRSDDHPRALHARSTARHRASPATPRQLPHVRRPGQRHASARLTDAANRRCTHRDYGPPLGVEGTPVSLVLVMR